MCRIPSSVRSRAGGCQSSLTRGNLPAWPRAAEEVKHAVEDVGISIILSKCNAFHVNDFHSCYKDGCSRCSLENLLFCFGGKDIFSPLNRQQKCQHLQCNSQLSAFFCISILTGVCVYTHIFIHIDIYGCLHTHRRPSSEFLYTYVCI